MRSITIMIGFYPLSIMRKHWENGEHGSWLASFPGCNIEKLGGACKGARLGVGGVGIAGTMITRCTYFALEGLCFKVSLLDGLPGEEWPSLPGLG